MSISDILHHPWVASGARGPPSQAEQAQAKQIVKLSQQSHQLQQASQAQAQAQQAQAQAQQAQAQQAQAQQAQQAQAHAQQQKQEQRQAHAQQAKALAQAQHASSESINAAAKHRPGAARPQSAMHVRQASNGHVAVGAADLMQLQQLQQQLKAQQAAMARPGSAACTYSRGSSAAGSSHPVFTSRLAALMPSGRPVTHQISRPASALQGSRR